MECYGGLLLLSNNLSVIGIHLGTFNINKKNKLGSSIKSIVEDIKNKNSGIFKSIDYKKNTKI